MSGRHLASGEAFMLFDLELLTLAKIEHQQDNAAGLLQTFDDP